jgi:integrase
MPRRAPPHVDAFTDRHGRKRYYFRRGKGARVALPGVPGSSEFEAAYAEALAGHPRPPTSLPGTKRGTIAWGIASYMRSPEYADLRLTTKKGYASRIEALRRNHGHRSISGMTREGIVKAILTPYADRPGQRLAILKMLRVLIRHWLEIGELRLDPSAGIRRPKSREIRAWSEDEIATFEQHWQPGTKQRLAFALMLYTGQRRSDVHRMTWADVKEGAIRVIQQKTRAALTIPLHPALAAILEGTAREHVTIINTAYGRPFTVDGFSGFMRDAIRAARLDLDAQPHGLRKAAGRRLAEAGCTAHEIMSVLGHKTLAEAERYTRDADQKGLARGAIDRVAAHSANKDSQTTPEKFGNDTGK